MYPALAIDPQLLDALCRAKNSKENRMELLCRLLDSADFAVMRRVPELFPFSLEEIEELCRWTTYYKGEDFSLVLLAKCKVSAERIGQIEELRSGSNGIWKKLIFGTNVFLESQLTAARLEIQKRGPEGKRARYWAYHILLNLADTDQAWLDMVELFMKEGVCLDFSQEIVKRFLRECPSQKALEQFAAHLVNACTEFIQQVTRWDQQTITYMHQVLMCLDRLGDESKIAQAGNLFHRQFPNSFPYSVQDKLTQFAKARAQKSFRP